MYGEVSKQAFKVPIVSIYNCRSFRVLTMTNALLNIYKDFKEKNLAKHDFVVWKGFKMKKFV